MLKYENLDEMTKFQKKILKFIQEETGNFNRINYKY